MNRMLVSSAALLIVAAAVSEAADVKSGLRPGQGVSAFNVQDITGPFKGKKTLLSLTLWQPSDGRHFHTHDHGQLGRSGQASRCSSW